MQTRQQSFIPVSNPFIVYGLCIIGSQIRVGTDGSDTHISHLKMCVTP